MSEERTNPNFNLESCLRNKVNEAKIYLEDKHKRQKDEPCEESSYAESFIYYFQNVETLLDLYKQEKEKNEELSTIKDGIQLMIDNGIVDEQYIVLANSNLKNPSFKYLLDNYINKDKIRDMQRYREFELQQQYKEFENDVEWKTYNKILEED